jgi:uncharacterized YigZ family protein
VKKESSPQPDPLPARPSGATPVLCYRIPAGEGQSETVIKNSFFIGSSGHVATVEEAHAFVARVRERYPDANHHAWAFCLYPGPQALIGFSDDGEPGGTAGRPMLAVLEGSGLREVVVVGTRYFGGTKLGTGGLVRAYSGAARAALEQLPTVACVLHTLARVTVDYSLYGTLEYTLPQHGVKIEEKEFAAQVTMLLAIPYQRVEEVARLLREWTNGQLILAAHRVGERYDHHA